MTHITAYTPPNHRPMLPLSLAFQSPRDRVDVRIAIDKYEIHVLSFASQTFCSTLIGVASFSMMAVGQLDVPAIDYVITRILTRYPDHYLVFSCVSCIEGDGRVIAEQWLLTACRQKGRAHDTRGRLKVGDVKSVVKEEIHLSTWITISTSVEFVRWRSLPVAVDIRYPVPPLRPYPLLPLARARILFVPPKSHRTQ